jgi:hypothetical protein
MRPTPPDFPSRTRVLLATVCLALRFALMTTGAATLTFILLHMVNK